MNDVIIQKIQREIKIREDDIADWQPTTPTLIRSKNQTQQEIKLLKSLLDDHESK